MDHRFFERPVINSPYAYPRRHWELDTQGQPTRQIIENAGRNFQYPEPDPGFVSRQGSFTLSEMS